MAHFESVLCEFVDVEPVMCAPLFEYVQALDDAPVPVLVSREEFALLRDLLPDRSDFTLYVYVGGRRRRYYGVDVCGVPVEFVPLFRVMFFRAVLTVYYHVSEVRAVARLHHLLYEVVFFCLWHFIAYSLSS